MNPATAAVLIVIVAPIIIGCLATYHDIYGGLPWTARGRMGVAYAREVDRRASDYVKLGIHPKRAAERAVTDMAKEAEDVLKEEEPSHG